MSNFQQMAAHPTKAEFVAASVAHNATTTQKPSIRDMAALSLAEAGKYADPIAKKFAPNPQFCEGQKPVLHHDGEFNQWNATSVANVAYLALNAAQHKEEYAAEHGRFVAWLTKQPANRVLDNGGCCIT